MDELKWMLIKRATDLLKGTTDEVVLALKIFETMVRLGLDGD